MSKVSLFSIKNNVLNDIQKATNSYKDFVEACLTSAYKELKIPTSCSLKVTLLGSNEVFEIPSLKEQVELIAEETLKGFGDSNLFHTLPETLFLHGKKIHNSGRKAKNYTKINYDCVKLFVFLTNNDTAEFYNKQTLRFSF